MNRKQIIKRIINKATNELHQGIIDREKAENEIEFIVNKAEEEIQEILNRLVKKRVTTNILEIQLEKDYNRKYRVEIVFDI